MHHSHANLKSNDVTHTSKAYKGLKGQQKSKLKVRSSILPN